MHSFETEIDAQACNVSLPKSQRCTTRVGRYLETMNKCFVNFLELETPTTALPTYGNYHAALMDRALGKYRVWSGFSLSYMNLCARVSCLVLYPFQGH